MNDFASELARELQRYANVVEEKLENEIDEVGDIAVGKLKQGSPKKQVLIVKDGARKKKVRALSFIIHKDN